MLIQGPIKNKAGFITKLEAILQNSSYQDVIAWSSTEDSFVILDPPLFQESILVNYFRHKRISSFVRQLNMYGFHKCRGDKLFLQFQHPLFKKQFPQQYQLIERKKPTKVTFQVPSMINIKEIDIISEDSLMKDVPEPLNSTLQQAEILTLNTRFRLNGSEMTIRLNQKLTSLCDIGWNNEGDKADTLSILGFESKLKIWGEQQEQVQTLQLTDGKHKANPF